MNLAQRIAKKYLAVGPKMLHPQYTTVDTQVKGLAHKIPSVRSVIERALGVHVKAMGVPAADQLLQAVYDKLDEIQTMLVEDTGLRMAHTALDVEALTSTEGPLKSALRGVMISKGQVDRDLIFGLKTLVHEHGISDEAEFALEQALRAAEGILDQLDQLASVLSNPRMASIENRVLRRFLASAQPMDKVARRVLRSNRIDASHRARRATITGLTTLQELVEMEVESMADEMSVTDRRKALDNVKVPPAVKEKGKAWDQAVNHALLEWCSKNMDVLNLGEGPLKGATTAQDVVGVMSVLRGGAGYLYFMEHEGHGVGTWDGDWDVLFKTPRPTIGTLSQHILSVTKQAYKVLKDAIFDAALDAMPEEELSDRFAANRSPDLEDLKRAKPGEEIMIFSHRDRTQYLIKKKHAPSPMGAEWEVYPATGTKGQPIDNLSSRAVIIQLVGVRGASTNRKAAVDPVLLWGFADMWPRMTLHSLKYRDAIGDRIRKYASPDRYMTAMKSPKGLDAVWAQVSVEVRSLQFRSHKWMSTQECIETLEEVCPYYGDFMLTMMRRFFLDADAKGVEIQIAREYSLCLYVKGSPETLDWLRMVAAPGMRADEADIRPDGTLRLWWD